MKNYKLWEENDRYKKSINKSTKHPIHYKAFITKQKVNDAKKLKEFLENELGIKMRLIRYKNENGDMVNGFLTSKYSFNKVQKYILSIDNFTDNEEYFNVKYYSMDLTKQF